MPFTTGIIDCAWLVPGSDMRGCSCRADRSVFDPRAGTCACVQMTEDHGIDIGAWESVRGACSCRVIVVLGGIHCVQTQTG